MNPGSFEQRNISPKEAIQLQKELAGQLVIKGKPESVKVIAGIDLAYDKTSNLGFCSILTFSFPELKLLDIYSLYDTVLFPYIPGLLSFREGPLILKTLNLLPKLPDVLIFDGQGIAHPRRLGIAAHIGVLLQIPSIGCAKSHLCGNYSEPGMNKGDMSVMKDKGEELGYVIRTRKNVKPIFCSPGHLFGIKEAADFLLNCLGSYRIPEPTRLADIEVDKFKLSVLKTNRE
ncbi:MAG: endonuclease V [Leptospiraceae bacterium]|nr:endonuclease V [Leptospiraceae bacterium]MCP5501665.1 endonuclease V [Leptospiraceae bacterium]